MTFRTVTTLALLVVGCCRGASLLPSEMTLTPLAEGQPSLHLEYVSIEKVVGGYSFTASVSPNKNSVRWLTFGLAITLSFSDGSHVEQTIQVPGQSVQEHISADHPAREDLLTAASLAVVDGSYVGESNVPSFSGPISPDKACYRDVQAALQLDGVRRRKALEDALRLGCVKTLDDDWQVIAQKPAPGFPSAALVDLVQISEYGSVSSQTGVVNRRDITRKNILTIITVKRGPIFQWSKA